MSDTNDYEVIFISYDMSGGNVNLLKMIKTKNKL